MGSLAFLAGKLAVLIGIEPGEHLGVAGLKPGFHFSFLGLAQFGVVAAVHLAEAAGVLRPAFGFIGALLGQHRQGGHQGS